MTRMKLLLYCEKATPYLYRKDDDIFELSNKIKYEDISDYKKYYGLNNGKIVAECDYEVSIHNWYNDYNLFEKLYYQENMMFNNENSCMSSRELVSYLGNNNLKKDFYAIHIKNLHIFDEPIDIRNYYNIATRTMADCMNQKSLLKAPQNMCNAYDVYKNHYILMSIKPEWLCKILNKEKTIEIRKKVLKEML